MKPNIASVRALNMKRGKTLPIWTEEEWSKRLQEREEKLDLTNLFQAWCKDEAEKYTIKINTGVSL